METNDQTYREAVAKAVDRQTVRVSVEITYRERDVLRQLAVAQGLSLSKFLQWQLRQAISLGWLDVDHFPFPDRNDDEK